MLLTGGYFFGIGYCNVFLAEHLNVPPEGNRGNDIFHSISANPGFNSLAHTDGESQNFDTTTTRHPKMAKLVNSHKNAQRYNQG
jgi:hypothetical protein